ncbi:MAG: PAS domain S-box protein [Tumebacillaceae bacterium]
MSEKQQIQNATGAKGGLRASRERLESFILHSADAIWMIDLNDRVRQINPAFEQLFGWTFEEVVEHPLPIIPEHLAEYIAEVHQQIKSGHSITGFETVRRCKDGRILHVSATLSPVRNNEGEVIGISGTCRDITQSKRMEEELRKTKERLESLIEHSADAIWMVDMNDRLLQVNPSFETLFGWSAREVIGHKLPIIPDFLHEEMMHLHQLIKTGRSLAGYETQRICKSGRLLYVSATLSPVRDNKGNVIGISGTCRDISVSKQAEEMLIRSEKLSIAGQLAAGLAHEIRNPLTSLKGFVQLMSLKEAPQKKYLDVMSSELNRIEMIVSELLMLAKPQAMTLKRKEIASILEDVLTLSDSEAFLKQVQIQTEVAEGLPAIECDENQLKQVFINFIKNAMEAMPNGGELRIGVYRQDHDHIRIRFQDEGVGISKETLARLGEPFYTTKTKGTGLGLMVCKKIIDNHKGSLDITSELGVGTTIEVLLPISPLH